MNKLFTKIATAFVGIAMAIGVGVAVGSHSDVRRASGANPGDSVTWTWTASSTNKISTTAGSQSLTGKVGNTNVSITATTAWTGGAAQNSYQSDYSGQQMGTGSSNMTAFSLTFQNPWGGTGTYKDYTKITSVSLSGGCGKSTSYTVSAKVDNTAATNTNSTTTLHVGTGSPNTCIFAPASGHNSGVIVLEVSKSSGSKAWYLSSVSITAEVPAASTYTVSFGVNTAGYGTVSSSSIANVPSGSSISVSNNTVTINGTTITATPTANTAQYTYAFVNWSNTSGTITDARTITANFSRTTNTFTVKGSITGGSLNNTDSIEYGGDLINQINPSDGYTYPDANDVTVMMGSTDITASAYNSSDGSILYEGVTGNIVITATCPLAGTPYEIITTVNNGTYTGATEIISGFTASIQFTPNDHYKLPTEDSAFTVSHAEIKSYNSSTGVLVIENPDDDVTIYVGMVAKDTFDVALSLTNVTKSSGPSGTDVVEEGEDVTIVFAANTNYGLPTTITVVMGNDTLVSGDDYEWTQNSGTLYLLELTDDLTVTIIGVAKTVTSISLSSNSGSYTLGDTFTMPTVTANYNVGASEDVTASATATGGGLENGVLTSAGTKTITISYGGQSATYTATVTAVVPSTGGIAKVTSTSDLTVGSTVYLVCEGRSKQLSGISTTSTKYGLGTDYTTTPANTYPLTVCAGNGGTGYAFKNSSNNYLYWTSGNSLNQDSSLSDNTSWTVSFDDDGNATILNVADSSREIMWNYSSPRFACYSGQTPTYDTASGYNMVQLYKNYPAVEPELKWITAEVKSGTYYQGSSVTSSDFTVTAHYDDGNTSTPTTDITVTNGELVNIGANEVTLTYDGKSCKVSVTAIEQTATLTGLTWDQGEYAIINGQGIDFSELGTITAEYDDGDSHATKSIAHCLVATYTKNGSDYVKATDLTDGDTLTSASHGKYLGISYTEGVVTKYAYSSAPIYVVEAINDVNVKVEKWSYSLVSTISVGDTVVMTGTKADDSSPYELTSVNGIGVVTAFATSNPSGTYKLEVVNGSADGTIAFKDAEGKYLSSTSDKSLSLSTTLSDSESWTITFTDVNARVINKDSGDPLQYNPGSRICVYHSDSQQPLKFYKATKGFDPTGEPISNTNAVAQKVVLEYATHFMTEMNCKADGTTADVATNWGNLKDDFDNWFNNGDKDLTPEQIAHAFELFEYADAVDGGDTLQNMLSKYEYIIGKYNKLGYGLEDFLHTNTDRPAVAQSAKITPFGVLKVNSSTSIIVIVTVGIAAIAIGGYFLLRKKKED